MGKEKKAKTTTAKMQKKTTKNKQNKK